MTRTRQRGRLGGGMLLLSLGGCAVTFPDHGGAGGASSAASTTGETSTTDAASSGDATNGSSSSSSSSSSGGSGGAGGSGGGAGGAGGDGGAGPCGGPPGLFEDQDLDLCAAESCCAQSLVCAAEPSLCFNEDDDWIDSPEGRDLYFCLQYANCEGVGPSELCGSGVEQIDFGYDPNLELVECFNAECCGSFLECCPLGDVAGCIDTLTGDAASYDEVCVETLRCALEQCGRPLLYVEVCDSTGLGSEDVDLGVCASENCCEEFTFCTTNGRDVDSCSFCLSEGGGGLCSAALTCMHDSCSFYVCDSGIKTMDPAEGVCLNDNCCEAYDNCSEGGAEVDACNECLTIGGGPRCDDAIACAATLCGGQGGAGGAGG